MTTKICLLGAIPKGDDKRETWKDWKVEYKEKLSKIPEAEFTDGDAWRDETRPILLVGHDSHMIKDADVIIVNAEKKLGAGTAQEILIAKYFSKPVITILPKDTHHRRSDITFDGTTIADWIHPFILTFSDMVADDLDSCIVWLQEYIDDPGSKDIKDISMIDQAIESYLKEK